tara:strand:- start:2986 stop:3906 length:921 start_codon:yes stop_codon:yes gene_type:complete
MSAERIFNIFIYFDGGVASDYGLRHHRGSGNDQDKKAFLLAHVDTEHPIARRFPLSRAFTPAQWLSVHRLGKVLEYFEAGFTQFRAPPAPVFCLTPVVDGVATVDLQTNTDPYRGDQVTRQEGGSAVADYLVGYVDDHGFRFTELINDDYFKAIRMLFHAQLYVSSAKLLMSCVDTLAYVEFGDVAGNFTKWIDKYVDLEPHGISSDELWEFRNSVLHMTNLTSRKVLSGKVTSIMPYVGDSRLLPTLSASNPKLFNLLGLITAISDGVGRWAETYSQDSDKFLTFIERYDLTISDSRVASFTLDP